MLKKKGPTAVQQLRATLLAQAHHAVVGPVAGEPSVLRIEGPGALSGLAQGAVVGHEAALRRAGFRVVECLGVDLEDERKRPGRLRALVPEDGAAWAWERTSGEELQARIAGGEESRPKPRAAEPERVAPVVALRRKR